MAAAYTSDAAEGSALQSVGQDGRINGQVRFFTCPAFALLIIRARHNHCLESAGRAEGTQCVPGVQMFGLAAAPTGPQLTVVCKLFCAISPPQGRVRLFEKLSSDDFRHPLDQQNTSLLRGLPGLELVAKTFLGPVAEQASRRPGAAPLHRCAEHLCCWAALPAAGR